MLPLVFRWFHNSLIISFISLSVNNSKTSSANPDAWTNLLRKIEQSFLWSYKKKSKGVQSHLNFPRLHYLKLCKQVMPMPWYWIFHAKKMITSCWPRDSAFTRFSIENRVVVLIRQSRRAGKMPETVASHVKTASNLIPLSRSNLKTSYYVTNSYTQKAKFLNYDYAKLKDC